MTSLTESKFVDMACKRQALWCRLDGKSPSDAIKLSDEELTKLGLSRDALEGMVEVYDEKEDSFQQALQEALKQSSPLVGPEIPDVPDGLVLDTSKKPGKMTKKLKKLLVEMSDCDLHPEAFMLRVGAHYSKTLTTLPVLQEWLAKLGGNLHWLPPPKTKDEFRAQVTYHSITKMWGDHPGNDMHETAGDFAHLTMAELQNCAKECGMDVHPNEGKVSLIVRVMKHFFADQLREE